MEIFQMKEAYLMRKLFHQVQSSSCTMRVLEVLAHTKEQNYKNTVQTSTAWFLLHTLSHTYIKKAEAMWGVGRPEGAVAEGPQQGQMDVPAP